MVEAAAAAVATATAAAETAAKASAADTDRSPGAVIERWRPRTQAHFKKEQSMKNRAGFFAEPLTKRVMPTNRTILTPEGEFVEVPPDGEDSSLLDGSQT